MRVKLLKKWPVKSGIIIETASIVEVSEERAKQLIEKDVAEQIKKTTTKKE